MPELKPVIDTAQDHKDLISHTQGNSPLKCVPDDYSPYPDGHKGGGKWFIIPEGNDAGKKLYFYDCIIGEGDPVATLVCVHGNPECSYSYRHVIDQLQLNYNKAIRVIAMDHIGFGRSDQASYEMVDMHHAANLIQLVRYLDLNNVTLMIHDWGGPIGVGAFLEDADRVSELMVLNTTIFPIPKSGLTFENYPVPIKFLSWSASGKNLPNKIWGTHAAFSVHAKPGPFYKLATNYLWYHIKSAFNLLPKTHNVYKDMLSTPANAKSSKRMVQQTPVWGHGYEYLDETLGMQTNHAFYQFIQNNVRALWGPEGKNIPVRLLFGSWDPVAKTSCLKQWAEALPQVKGHIEIFKGVSHFVAEHRPKEIAGAIIELINSKQPKAK